MTHSSRPRRRPRALAAAAIATGTAAALILTACSAGTPSAETTPSSDASPVSGGTLRYLAGAEPGTWDAAKVPGLALLAVNSSIFDTVVSQNADGSYGPGLAESWDVSEDGTEYTFHLRDDVTFHDGEAFDAEALEVNLRRPLDPESGLNPSLPIKDTEVVDPQTLTVTLTSPDATAIHALSTPHIPIYSPKVLAEHSNAEIGADPRLSVGTGPFTVSDYTRGSSVTLERFDDYDWAPESLEHSGPAYLDSVEIQFVPEPQARVGAFESNQADAIDAVPPLNAAQLSAGGERQILEAENAGLPYSLSLNTNVAPFDDIRVREAFRDAIDIDALLQSIYAGYYEKAWTVVTEPTAPDGSYNADLEGSWGYDPEAAAALLDEAGWDTLDDEGYRTKDGERLTLQWKDDNLYIQQDQRQQLGEAIAAAVKDVGIEVVRTQYDTAGYAQELAKNEHHLAPSSRGYADVETPTLVFASVADPREQGARINYGLTSDEDIDAWYQELTVSDDAERRAELGREVQKKVNDEVYAIPLYVPKKLVGAQNTVHGWAFDRVGYTDSLVGVWLEQ
ncbi:MAG: ABC transporter substrate-binding protein [Mycetocola sp.]